jgi:NAD(P)-dependent dehydrogenase (short-subunit alcohol dehydrogenase family)
MHASEPHPNSDDSPELPLDDFAHRTNIVPPSFYNLLFDYLPSNKLTGKVALIAGGDSEIGRAVAIAFAKEGADIALFYEAQDDRAEDARAIIEKLGHQCLAIKGNTSNFDACRVAVEQTIVKLGKLNILVNQTACETRQQRLEDITAEQFRHTVETQIIGYFNLIKAAIPYLNEKDTIINTGNLVAERKCSLDYAASKGAIRAMTNALAVELADRQIRVNAAIATGRAIADLDSHVVCDRAARLTELASAYVFLASEESRFVTGALLDVSSGQLFISQ